MEDISYGTEHIMRYFRMACFVPDEIIACGGATKSRLWMQIQTDASGFPILVPVEPNVTLPGDAILAAVGSGNYSSVDEAVNKMVSIKEKIMSDLENSEKYSYCVDKYISTYLCLKDLMHEIVDHEDNKNFDF